MDIGFNSGQALLRENISLLLSLIPFKYDKIQHNTFRHITTAIIV